MNLRAQIELRFGGPGSGCNPRVTRCGRRGKGWYGVDFDGTLAKLPRGGWKAPTELGDPVPRMVNRVKKLLELGHDVRLFTARAANHNPRELRALREWMKTHIGRALTITNEKDMWLRRIYDDSARRIQRDQGRVLNAGLQQIELERKPLERIENGYIQQSGALWCVRSTNPQDRNFGCYGSKEQAEAVLRGKSFTGVGE